MSGLVRTCRGVMAFHPGYFLQELVDERDGFSEDFIRATGIDREEYAGVLNGSRLMSEEFMRKLTGHLGTSSEMWRNLQDDYLSKIAVMDILKRGRTLVFLDIDGVLNAYDRIDAQIEDDLYRTQGVWSLPVRRVNALCRLLDARIVLSSTWRFLSDGLEDTRRMLATMGIEAECIGVTVDNHKYTRTQEIDQWIRTHFAEKCHILVLDDESLDLRLGEKENAASC